MRAARGVVGFVVSMTAIAGSASAAAAHGTGSDVAAATNYETRVDAISPPTPGVRVRAVDLGASLELRNTGSQDVVVIGYHDEPYLRVGPAGVFENRRSPAVSINESPDRADVQVPDSADPSARPEWRRIGSGDSVRWHDHRAHWMGPEDPPAVQRDPDSRHVVVSGWTVELRRAGQTIAVTGDVGWIPPPSPWPWLLAGLLVGAAVVGASRLWRWPAVLVAALGAATGAAGAHLAGEWGATTASAASLLGASVYTIGGIALGGVALALLLARDEPLDAIPAVLIAGIVLALGTGLADVSSLSHSQLASTHAPTIVRIEVAGVLGLGVGLAVAAALRLRTPARARTRAAAPTPRPTGRATS